MTTVARTLTDLAAVIDADVRGDASQVITGIATLKNAQPGQISFLDNPRYRCYLATTQASAVILSPDIAEEYQGNALVIKNPYLAYAKIAAVFDPAPPVKNSIHPTAVIGENCQIHPSVSIAAQAVIDDEVVLKENVVIGAGCYIGAKSSIGVCTRLYPHVTVYHSVNIGRNTIIHSGAVIGSDGFGIAKDQGVWHKIPQIGSVKIGDNVEIGANTTIDRGAIEDTIIEEGAKLDNQIQIGHNVKIGAHTAIAGCVGIAGSTTIGKRCSIGGAAGIAGHITIADDVMITANSGVTRSITEPGVYSSTIIVQPAVEWRKILARIYQLDNTTRKLYEIEKWLMKLGQDIKNEE